MNLIPRKTLDITYLKRGGGFPEETIDLIDLTDVKLPRSIIKTLDNNYIFKFNDTNNQHEYGSKYLGKGALTAVYGISLIEQKPENKFKIPLKYKDDLILRIYENTEDELDIKPDIDIDGIDVYNDAQTKIINMWTTHKRLFPINIIDLFLYGAITLNGEYVGYYTITRKYFTDKKIKILDIKDKLTYLKNMYTFFKDLDENNYTYRDIKMANVGTDDELNFIVLDYDQYTILNEDEINNLKTEYTIRFTVGTYPPIYIIEQGSDFNYKLTYLGGLLDILLKIFDENLKGNSDYDEFIGIIDEYLYESDMDIRNDTLIYITPFSLKNGTDG